MSHKIRKIGAHVSAAGVVDKAVERAAGIGANCVQVFSGSPRVWQRPNLDAVDADKVFSKEKELSVEPIFTHALYLVNLASENPDLVRAAKTMLVGTKNAISGFSITLECENGIDKMLECLWPRHGAFFRHLAND